MVVCHREEKKKQYDEGETELESWESKKKKRNEMANMNIGAIPRMPVKPIY
jgi:hypothetical protein